MLADTKDLKGYREVLKAVRGVNKSVRRKILARIARQERLEAKPPMYFIRRDVSEDFFHLFG